MDNLALIVAPDGQVFHEVQTILGFAGVQTKSANSMDIIDAISGNDHSIAIITEDGLLSLDLDKIGSALAAQPPWADFPFILLTEALSLAASVAARVEVLGNVTLLGMPIRPQTLASAALVAFRGRERQRRAKHYLAEREIAEERFRDLAMTLEARVIERAAELDIVSFERKTALERLKESEELYRYTVELSSLVPWTADRFGQLQTMGANWSDLTGLAIAETVGDGWSSVLHPDDRKNIVRHWHRIAKRGKELDVNFRVRLTNGTYRWHRARAAPRLSPNGEVIRYYGTIADIHDQKEANERLENTRSELIHVSRLSAMNAMASTLAHELNQPLTAISNYMRGCMRLMDGQEGASAPLIVHGLTEADNSAMRAGEIMRRLREMVAQGNVEKVMEDLPLLIEQACKIALVDAPVLEIEHRLDLAADARTVIADRIQIQQVLINILRNAIDVLRDRTDGQIVIETRVRSKKFCEVVVRDNGPGLPPKVREKLFSTFNSTKKDGMGIGLSISRTIIETHGGEIWAESVPDGGTAFHFTLLRPT